MPSPDGGLFGAPIIYAGGMSLSVEGIGRNKRARYRRDAVADGNADWGFTDSWSPQLFYRKIGFGRTELKTGSSWKLPVLMLRPIEGIYW